MPKKYLLLIPVALVGLLLAGVLVYTKVIAGDPPERRPPSRPKGRLTLKGRTNDVSFELKARRNGASIEVNGTIPVTFADYGISNPSAGPAQVGDAGEVEVLLVFANA